jgi:hypothetical protein
MVARNRSSVVGLLLLCATCLPACDDDSACPVKPAPILSGSPLFDAGECGQLPFAAQGAVYAPIAVCRTGDGLHRPCDETFVRSCIDGGAYFSPVSGGSSSPPSDPICATGSELAPDCNRNFEEACWREGGVYACSDQNCLMGQCNIPQGYLQCHEQDGFETCYCTDIKACISADKICQNFTCLKMSFFGVCTEGDGDIC